MNQIAFSKALKFTIGTGGKDLGEEGGYVNDPHDHGGCTNRGITQNALDAFMAQQHLPFMDVMALTDDEETVRAFYADVWVKAHCDDMSLGLATAHFDWAVNHGVDGAIKNLQRTLQVADDGIYGTGTRAALLAQDHDDLYREYNQLRRDWYETDISKDPSQARFAKGWLGRVDRLDAYEETL